jgi:hypothetical protein
VDTLRLPKAVKRHPNFLKNRETAVKEKLCVYWAFAAHFMCLLTIPAGMTQPEIQSLSG